MIIKQLSIKKKDSTLSPFDFVIGPTLTDFLLNIRKNGWRGDNKQVYSNFILELIK